jgi:hypothetical protein
MRFPALKGSSKWVEWQKMETIWQNSVFSSGLDEKSY